jgi:hypothetical protein
MNRLLTLSTSTAAVLLAATTFAAAQQSPPSYVDVGRDFRQSNQVTMGSNLLTPEEQSRFDTMRQQAKTRADKDRVEAQESALLNQRVNERINSALSQPVSPGTPSTAERPMPDLPGSSGPGSSGPGSSGMGSGSR